MFLFILNSNLLKFVVKQFMQLPYSNNILITRLEEYRILYPIMLYIHREESERSYNRAEDSVNWFHLCHPFPNFVNYYNKS